MTDLMSNLLTRLEQFPKDGLPSHCFNTPDKRMLGRAITNGWVVRSRTEDGWDYRLLKTGREALVQFDLKKAR